MVSTLLPLSREAVEGTLATASGTAAMEGVSWVFGVLGESWVFGLRKVLAT